MGMGGFWGFLLEGLGCGFDQGKGEGYVGYRRFIGGGERCTLSWRIKVCSLRCLHADILLVAVCNALSTTGGVSTRRCVTFARSMYILYMRALRYPVPSPTHMLRIFNLPRYSSSEVFLGRCYSASCIEILGTITHQHVTDVVQIPHVTNLSGLVGYCITLSYQCWRYMSMAS